jgi:hypothetical protein
MATILYSIPHSQLKAVAVAVVTDGQHFPTAKESKAAVVVDLERRMPLQLLQLQPNLQQASLELIHLLQRMDEAVAAQLLLVEFKLVLAEVEQPKMAGLPLRVETMLPEKVAMVSPFQLQVRQSLMQVVVAVLHVSVDVRPVLQLELEGLAEVERVPALEPGIKELMA